MFIRDVDENVVSLTIRVPCTKLADGVKAGFGRFRPRSSSRCMLFEILLDSYLANFRQKTEVEGREFRDEQAGHGEGVQG